LPSSRFQCLIVCPAHPSTCRSASGSNFP
jgi:hypothetical protein